MASGKSRKFGVFLFFCVLSSVFWTLQTLDEVLETEVDVDVRLEGVPSDVVITQPLPPTIRVKVRDKGTVLLQYLRRKHPPIKVNFTEYHTANTAGRVVMTDADLQRLLAPVLQVTSRVQQVTPDTLDYYYNYGAKKTIPVKVSGRVEAASAHYLRSLTTEPSQVTVWATPAVLDTLKAVYTQPLTLPSMVRSTTERVALRPIPGVKYGQETVEVKANVDVYVEQTVTVPVSVANFPADRNLRTFPASVEVTYTVGYARRQEIEQEDFAIVFTYEQLLELQRQGAKRLPIELRAVPAGVLGVRVSPQELDYIVEDVDTGE